MDYKTKMYVLKLNRKIVAARLGLSYAALNARLNNFTPWQFKEENELRKIIDQTEAGQTAEAEKDVPYYVK
jgi:hypothetical protein